MPGFQFSYFQYEPLSTPTSIRLLTVRNPLAKASPTVCGVTLLSCKLAAADLEDSPHFNTLSYTWGNPNPLEKRPSEADDEYAPQNQWPISVNSQVIFVTKNLYECLSQLKIDEWSEDTEVDARFEPYDKTRLIQAAEEGRYDDVEDCLRHGAELNSVDCFGETALHYAAENGHLEIVELLIAQGADRTIVDSTHRTPLDCCVQQKRRRHLDIAKVLENESDPVATVTGPAVRHHRSKQIWIDAICVNQTDIAERNAQVAMMSRIYGQAQSVIVWLGAFGSSSAAELYHQMPTILSSSAECFKRSWDAWHRSKRGDETDDDRRQVEAGTLISADNMEVVLEFVRRSYFHRIWVLQEVALARNIRIMFGGDDLPWSALFQVFQSAIDFEYVGLDYNTKLVKYRYGDMGTLAWSLADVRLHSRRTPLEDSIVTAQLESLRATNPEFVAMENDWWHSKLPLSTLIALTWNFAATDPRDKIFALLNIARPMPGEEPIVADYGKSVTDVFAQVAKTFIQARGDNRYQDWRSGEIEDLEPLEALSFVQNLNATHDGWCWLRPFAETHTIEPRPDDMPSWVPSFHWPLSTRRLFNTKFRAAGATKANIYPFISNVLQLDALRVDTLTGLEEQRRGAGGDDNAYCYCGTANVLGWLRVMDTLPPIYPTGCDRVEALWQVLTANCYLKRAFPLSVYSYAEDPVGEDFADYILETLPGEIVDRRLCSDEGVPDEATAAWLREVFAKDSSGSFPDIEDVLAAVKARKEKKDKSDDEEGNGEEGNGEEAEDGDDENEDDEQASADDNSDESRAGTPNSDTESFEKILPTDAAAGVDREAVAQAPEDEGSKAADASEADGSGQVQGQQAADASEAAVEEGVGRAEGEEQEEEKDGINSFEYFMWCVWPLRRVASTANGHLGLVPRTAQAGDEIWLFGGGRTPYILRPTAEQRQYIFVGEAYVHGIMDGEAAQGKSSDFGLIQLM